MNKFIRDDIYKKYVQVTRLDLPKGLKTKMAFYAKHYLKLNMTTLFNPLTQSSTRCMSLGSLWANVVWALIGLWIEAKQQNPHEGRFARCVIWRRLRWMEEQLIFQ